MTIKTDSCESTRRHTIAIMIAGAMLGVLTGMLPVMCYRAARLPPPPPETPVDVRMRHLHEDVETLKAQVAEVDRVIRSFGCAEVGGAP